MNAVTKSVFSVISLGVHFRGQVTPVSVELNFAKQGNRISPRLT